MAASSPEPPAERPFSTVQTNAASPLSPNGTGKDEVESPSLSNTSTALARFEFEAGRGSADGTKVLMVEWEDDDTTRGVRGNWHISWEGKKTVLPAADREAASGSGAGSGVRRLYFLLPPGVAVPSIVTLTLVPQDASTAAGSTVWRTNPLPAIFPPELGASARAAGKKGVLHTIWAKKRLQVLKNEIEAESRSNVEGVGLMMAVQERDWIEQNFGVTTRPANLADVTSPGLLASSAPLASPGSPRSPGGGRLMDKLKGLKLGTSDRDLVSSGAPDGGSGNNPLSPESSDVAVSSFSTIKGMQMSSSPPPAAGTESSSRKVSAQSPPPAVAAAQQHQRGSSSGMGSLNAFAGGGPEALFKSPPASAANASSASSVEDEKDEQGLFALPMSPRSPEMTKSPFSFGVADTRKYVGGRA